ncbi:hypothetical protein UFOVP422_33 [uncultured Caudovirales phage]|uniref:Uncharacterized protein n=1 Tax=uncultured Caudovirales phage TaxID=2100421 RepID=A0A6J5M517_9CAUD|nr:hypothetical protein UFOVP422_33 [uncultured Caudovirales phage]
MTTANQIFQQLGSTKFVAMTGASFATAPDGLVVMLRGGAVNRMIVKLNAADLYDVTFLKVRGLNVKTVSETRNVPGDSLVMLFEETTGFDASL